MSKHKVGPVQVGQGERSEVETMSWGSRTRLASRALSGSALTRGRRSPAPPRSPERGGHATQDFPMTLWIVSPACVAFCF